MKPTVVLQAKELARHARKIADGLAKGCGHEVVIVPRRVSNPTLVAHGLTKAALWHVIEAGPPAKAVADLYVGNQAEARRIGTLLANMLKTKGGRSVTLKILNNASLPASLRDHPTAYVESNPSRSSRARQRRQSVRVSRRVATAVRTMRLGPVTPKARYRAASHSSRLARFKARVGVRGANPKGRKTVREGVAILLDAGGFKVDAWQVRKGKVTPMAALATAVSRELSMPKGPRQKVLTALRKAIGLVERAPNPSRTKTARARRKASRVLSHRQRRSLAKAGFTKSAQTRHLIVGQIRRGMKRGLPHGRRANPKRRKGSSRKVYHAEVAADRDPTGVRGAAKSRYYAHRSIARWGRSDPRRWVEQLRKNADDYHFNRITHAVFDARQLKTWKEIEALHPSVKRRVLAELRRKPRPNPKGRNPAKWNWTASGMVPGTKWIDARDVADAGVRRWNWTKHGMVAGTKWVDARDVRPSPNPKGRIEVPDQAFKDWAEGRAYWSQRHGSKVGNFRLYAERRGSQTVGTSRMAPWNRAVKKAFPGSSGIERFGAIATQMFGPRGNPKRRIPGSRVKRSAKTTRRPRARTTRALRGRHANPGSPIETASRTVRMFQDRGPVKVTKKQMKSPPALKGTAAELGKLVAVVYRSDKFDGKEKDYEHEFGPKLPSLVTDPHGKGLHIVGGGYKITSDGIVN